MGTRRQCRWLLAVGLTLLDTGASGGESPPGNAEILKKLDLPATVALRGTAWEDTFREVSDSLDCRIEVEKPFPDTRSLWLWSHTLPGRRILDLICELTERSWTIHKGSVVICSRERAWELLEHPRREYDLGAALGEPRDAPVVLAVVQHVLGPPSGAWGARVALEGERRLVVTAPEADHKLVARLIEGIRALPRNGSVQLGSPAPRQSPGRRMLQQCRQNPEWARKKLEEHCGLEFTETALHKVLEHAAKLRKVNIRLDPGAAAPDAPVSLKVGDVPFGRALDLIARTADLTTYMTSDLIVFHRREGQDEHDPPLPPTLAVHDFTDVAALGWSLDEVVDFLRRHSSGGENAAPRDEEDQNGKGDNQDAAKKKAAQPDPKVLAKGPGDGDFTARLGTRVIVGVASDWREHLAWVVTAMRERKNPPQRPAVTDTYAPGLAEKSREQACRPSDAEDAPNDAFDRPVTIHLDHTSVRNALTSVATALGCAANLDDDDVPRDLRSRQIALHLDDAPGSLPLALLCFALGAGWVPRAEEGRVSLSHESADSGDTESELYLAWGAVGTRDEAIELAAAIEKLLNERGARAGAAPRTSCRARPGYYLDVSGTRNALAFVHHLRSWLANIEPGEHRELPDPTGRAEELRYSALQVKEEPPAGLAAKMKVHVRASPKGAPVAEALADLGAQAKLTILLDPDAELQKAEVKTEGDNLTLADALRAIEEQTATTHVATAHALLLTTPERARLMRPASWALYDVRNIAADDAAAAELAQRLLRDCEKHKEWGRHHFIERHKRRLIVCTTAAVHERILATLKDAASQAPRK